MAVLVDKLHTHETSWDPSNSDMKGFRIDRAHLVVLDNFIDEAARTELLNFITEEDWDHQKGPPDHKWERATCDAAFLPATWGLKDEVLRKLAATALPAKLEVQSRLCKLFPEYDIFHMPSNSIQSSEPVMPEGDTRSMAMEQCQDRAPDNDIESPGGGSTIPGDTEARQLRDTEDAGQMQQETGTRSAPGAGNQEPQLHGGPTKRQRISGAMEPDRQRPGSSGGGEVLPPTPTINSVAPAAASSCAASAACIAPGQAPGRRGAGDSCEERWNAGQDASHEGTSHMAGDAAAPGACPGPVRMPSSAVAAVAPACPSCPVPSTATSPRRSGGGSAQFHTGQQRGDDAGGTEEQDGTAGGDGGRRGEADAGGSSDGESGGGGGGGYRVDCHNILGNAPVYGDCFSWHVDADPWTFPPSPWVDEFGNYFNRELGQPLLVSLLLYLDGDWPREWDAETLFLDTPTDTGILVRPKRGRAVLMDQDVLHRVSTPSQRTRRPRYSLVWKLAMVPRSAQQAPTIARPEWGRPTAFGSAAAVERAARKLGPHRPPQPPATLGHAQADAEEGQPTLAAVSCAQAGAEETPHLLPAEVGAQAGAEEAQPPL